MVGRMGGIIDAVHSREEFSDMAVPGPDPRAAARGVVAIALDMARVDPDRRPTAEMCRWCARLADELGVPPRGEIDTNRELVFEALRLELIAHHRVDADTAAAARRLTESRP
jgi:hypothetical protein